MYIKKQLVSALMVTSLAAGVAFAQTRYELNQGPFTLSASDEGATIVAAPGPAGDGQLPYFVAVTQSGGDQNDVSTVENFGDCYALKLNTEGDTLEFKVTDEENAPTSGPIAINPGEEIYVQTRMQFVPSEDKPGDAETADVNAKIALWVNAQSNLVVRHGRPIFYQGEGDLWFYETGSVDITDSVVLNDGEPVFIDPTLWYNVKIILRNEVLEGAECLQQAFQIYIGESDPLLTGSANAMSDAWVSQLDEASLFGRVASPDMNGAWFLSCLPARDSTSMDSTVEVLDNLSFKGTGAIASIALSTMPLCDVTALAKYFDEGDPLTLMSGGGSVSVSASPVAANTTVIISYTADNANYTFDHWLVNGTPTEAGLDDEPGTISVVITAATEVVAVFQYAGVTPTPEWIGPNGDPLSAKILAWLQDLYPDGVDLSAMDGDLLSQAYLLNILPEDLLSVKFVITSFSVDPVGGTWELAYYLNDAPTTPVYFKLSDWNVMNGRGLIQGAKVLAGAEAGWDPIDVNIGIETVDSDEVNVFTVDPANVGEYKFFKLGIVDEEDYQAFFDSFDNPPVE